MTARRFLTVPRRHPGSLEAHARETSARAFTATAPRDTAPSPPLDPAAYPHLTFVQCKAYGTCTQTTCRDRYTIANAPTRHGQGAIDASNMKLSACNGCDQGVKRWGAVTRARKVHEQAACACGEPVTPPLVRCPACLARHRTTQGHGMRIGKGREPQQERERKETT